MMSKKADFARIIEREDDLLDAMEVIVNQEKIKKEALEKLESRFTTLEVPVVIDRSAQEEDELAQAEWIKVYGALFGCDEEAAKIFEKKVKEAEKNEKN